MTAQSTELDRVAQYEAGLRRGPMTAVLRTAGRTRAFSFVYRYLGPRIDPWLMHHSQGRIATRLYGLPALLLTTVGAKTGRRRDSPLLYVRDGSAPGSDFVVVGTNFGQLHHPGWTANLLKAPDAEIEVGPVRLPVTAELVDEAGWDRLWPRFVACYPGYQDYLGRTGGRLPRMFRLTPRQDGTPGPA